MEDEKEQVDEHPAKLIITLENVEDNARKLHFETKLINTRLKYIINALDNTKSKEETCENDLNENEPRLDDLNRIICFDIGIIRNEIDKKLKHLEKYFKKEDNISSS